MAISPTDTESLLLDVSGVTLHVNPEEFPHLCQSNPDLRLELTKDGELIVILLIIPRTTGRGLSRKWESRNIRIASGYRLC
ncbi:MAG: hypothetical protein N5P05_000236 [Chroococcopsis gigantea SAG 12.99]|jgi:Uma2 family endonuclease|nr:hypothetical protein [Chroococcopsis gigantea SAG 12.99]